jgi:hypothetical protein
LAPIEKESARRMALKEVQMSGLVISIEEWSNNKYMEVNDGLEMVSDQ